MCGTRTIRSMQSTSHMEIREFEHDMVHFGRDWSIVKEVAQRNVLTI
jgi:hypothetical protein